MNGEEALVLFTSGTTGTPKPVTLTWSNFDANARASSANLPASPTDRWLLCLPLFHIGAFALVHRCFVSGATVVMEDFDAPKINALIDGGEITHASLVTTTLQRLLDDRGDRPVPPTMKAVLIGGGPVTIPLLARARKLGLPVLQTYGLTEACSQVATERLGEADGEPVARHCPASSCRSSTVRFDCAARWSPLGPVNGCTPAIWARSTIAAGSSSTRGASI